MSEAFTVTIAETHERFRCRAEQTVLEGMEALGKRGIPVGCRGGGCGVCKVHVLAGTYHAEVMSLAHVSAADRAEGKVLACAIRPTSHLTLTVLGSMRRAIVTLPAAGGP